MEIALNRSQSTVDQEQHQTGLSDEQLLEEIDALYQDFSGATCLGGRIAEQQQRKRTLEQLINGCFRNADDQSKSAEAV